MPATRVTDPPAQVARNIDRLERAHARARGRGESRALYVIVRFAVTPILRLWFRARISGADQIPAVGPVIVAPNHKSFLDAFFIGIATRRHVRYMVKTEVFRGPLGPLLVRLGAFPVRRGEADADALLTARTILGHGGVVVVFPEGTRVEDPHALGSPHHGAGRLALETGAPVVPAAIAGTDHLWLGPIARPRRVQLAFLPPLDPCRLVGRSDALTELVDHELWPSVLEQYGRQVHAEPQLLGVVEPLNVRRRKARRWPLTLSLPGRTRGRCRGGRRSR